MLPPFSRPRKSIVGLEQHVLTVHQTRSLNSSSHERLSETSHLALLLKLQMLEREAFVDELLE